MRLCLGAISFGAFADLEADIFLGRLPGMEIFFPGRDWMSPIRIQAAFVGGLPIFYIFSLALFAFPLAVITNKLVRAKPARFAIMTMLGIIVLIPVMLCNVAYHVFFESNAALETLLPNPGGIAQLKTSCDVTAGKIKVNSYLILLNAKSYVLTGDSFSASAFADENDDTIWQYLGKGSSDQNIVLSDSGFVPVQLSLQPPENAPKAKEGHFACSLSLTESLRDLQPMRIHND